MRLEICCEDRVGIVQEVLNILVLHQINLRKIEVAPSKQRMYVAFVEIEFEELQMVMPKIRKTQGIGDVKTIAFIPSEREHNELKTLLRALPDGIISLDVQGKVLIANQSSLSSLGCVASDVIGQSIQHFFNGFDFVNWLEQDDISAQTIKLSSANEQFVADLLPVRISGEELGSNLVGAVLNLKSESRLGQQVGAFRQQSLPDFSGIICKSSGMKKVLRDAQKMAHLSAPMLLTGETGTGKETLAKACHDATRGIDSPFVAINCASIPDEDAEVELFGRASTAVDGINKLGLLEQANGGTIFLDEVGDMSPDLQAKLVRFLHDGSFRRVGDEKEVSVDVRVTCSTQKDLNELVQKGDFREDLFYRLNVLTLTLPPLRERKQDVIPLALHFIHQFARQMGSIVPGIDSQCEAHIKDYAWPGNVRQLENALFRAVTLLDGDKITLQSLQLPTHTKTRVIEAEITGTLDDAVKQYEAGILRELFPSFPSSRQLAKRLGLSHTAVANKLREYGISKKSMNGVRVEK
jgi:transcriptional regulator of aroF, aroG, tyrA and aromatic amino acid transport